MPHGYRGELLRVDRTAGPAEHQRWNWTQIVPAGATANLLGLTYTPMDDLVLYYQSTANSTESCRLVVTQGNTHADLPILLDLGPLGGGSIRLSGAVGITVTVENLVAGQAEIQIWLLPAAQVQHVPPLTALGSALQQNVPQFISPDPGSLGWCPPQRPRLSFLSTQNCELDFLDAGGGFFGRITYQPNVSNREVEILHPPKLRLRVNNTGPVNAQCAVTWFRS